MRLPKIHDIEDITHIREMTLEEAYRYISHNQPRQITLNQAHALSMLTLLNTREDWLRLQACLVILKQKRQSPRETLENAIFGGPK